MRNIIIANIILRFEYLKMHKMYIRMVQIANVLTSKIYLISLMSVFNHLHTTANTAIIIQLYSGIESYKLISK